MFEKENINLWVILKRRIVDVSFAMKNVIIPQITLKRENGKENDKSS